MTSFLARAFAVLADQPATICVVLATSRQVMNCSAIPVTLSTDLTWDLLCSIRKTDQKLLQLFSNFSDTMQFTEKLRIQNRLDEDFVKGILENLIKHKRYFSRTIRLLQLPSADALIEACSLDSSTPTSPNRQLLSNLRSLSFLGRSALQNKQLKTICSQCCPFLENLNIPCQPLISHEGIACLSNLKRLHSLNLASCKLITDTGLEHLARLSSLLSLDLNNCDKITDSGLQHLAKLLSLQSLNIGWCDKITDSGLQHLANLPSIQTLNLSFCDKITDSGLEHLATLSFLRSLTLNGCKLVTNNGLEHIAKLSLLETLTLNGCKLVTDIGLQYLSQLSSLQTIKIVFCNKITDSGCRVFSASTEVVR